MLDRKISRRRFLALSGLSLAGGALVVSGCAPKVTAKVVETPSYAYGTAGNPRVLVGYATRTGSTVGVAAAIGEELGGRGFAVDVKPMKDDPDPQGYDAVILGSAVNGGKWLPEAVEYAGKHQQALNESGVALFCVHIMNLDDDETSRKNRLAYLDDVRALVTPVEEAYFAGMGMNPEDTSGFVRWVYRTFDIGPEGDNRDWEKIRGWGKDVEV